MMSAGLLADLTAENSVAVMAERLAVGLAVWRAARSDLSAQRMVAPMAAVSASRLVTRLVAALDGRLAEMTASPRAWTSVERWVALLDVQAVALKVARTAGALG